jgi:hypothetical protein
MRVVAQLSRESEFFVVVRVYVFSGGFNAANQSSAACDQQLRRSVETSTPPFGTSRTYSRRGAVQPESHGMMLLEARALRRVQPI